LLKVESCAADEITDRAATSVMTREQHMDDSPQDPIDPADATEAWTTPAVTEPRPDPDFYPLVKRALFIAVFGWCVKVVTMVRVNAELGGIPHIRKWSSGIPYLAFEIDNSGFEKITSTSTVVLSFVMLAFLVSGLLRNKGRMEVAGWCFAPVSLAYTIALDLLMESWRGGYTDLSRLRWAFGSLSLSALLVAWWIASEHPHEALLRWREGSPEQQFSP
jgi:hypothetical protein